MRRLHHGHPRLAGLAAAALALALGVLIPTSAAAETIGGEQLGHTKRTVSLQPGADPLPEVWAETWILADADTGEVLAQKGSHVQRAPASTLKMLTALAVMPNTTPEAEYVATRRAATIYGARVGLKPGKTYTMDQLWYAVFLPSANDAAIAVAEANGGVKHTIKLMNAVAADLNARDTVARNTSGLDAPGQLSSAYDLALIARAGLQRPDFARYASTPRAEFPNVKGKGNHPIYSTNRLLLHGWKGMIGVKTGFTTKAGRTYVGAATRERADPHRLPDGRPRGQRDGRQEAAVLGAGERRQGHAHRHTGRARPPRHSRRARRDPRLDRRRDEHLVQRDDDHPRRQQSQRGRGSDRSGSHVRALGGVQCGAHRRSGARRRFRRRDRGPAATVEAEGSARRLTSP